MKTLKRFIFRSAGRLTALVTFGLVSTVGSAATVNATYNGITDVPVTAGSYTATGNTVNFTLNFAPGSGTDLMVVKNTGLNFITGAFDNLAQGQPVLLSFSGAIYQFVANYYGGSGNDLVLVWANQRPFAWGWNHAGQLGDGTTSSRNLPVPVSAVGLLAGQTVIAAAAGGIHSLAVCADGTVAAWGFNGQGQLGDNSTTDRSVPAAVNAESGVSALYGKRVVAVAGGGHHSLALCSDGTVASWGWNNRANLDDSSTTDRQVPVAVYRASTVSALYGKTVVAIAAGYYHSLALCSDGTVASWGWNFYGSLGDGTILQRQWPVAVNTGVGVSALYGKTVVAIAAGYYHNLALCSDGTVAAWGDNSRGGLGDSTATQRNVPVAVNTGAGVSALYGKTVVAIAAGFGHSLALCSDGTVAAWGANGFGELGDNTQTDRFVPVAVNTASNVSALYGKTVVAIAPGGYHSLALCSDGTMAAWGHNNSGSLGDHTWMGHLTPVGVDTTPLAAGERFTLVAGGSYATHSLALAAAPFPPLQLRVQGGAATVTLQWPACFSGLIPQSKPVLAASGGWADLGDVPVISGSNCAITLPATNANRFFRLRSP